MDVFNIYVRMDPKAGRYIYDIFNHNVSDYWWRKTEFLSIWIMKYNGYKIFIIKLND